MKHKLNTDRMRDISNCSNCNTLNNISYPFSLEAVECERLLFC